MTTASGRARRLPAVLTLTFFLAFSGQAGAGIVIGPPPPPPHSYHVIVHPLLSLVLQGLGHLSGLQFQALRYIFDSVM